MIKFFFLFLLSYCTAMADPLLQGKLKGQEENFARSAQKYGISAKVLTAICCWETDYGKSRIINRYNNASGSMRRGKPMRFISVAASIEYTARNLSLNYYKQGKTSVSSISRKYCPKGSGAWVKGVTGILKKLK